MIAEYRKRDGSFAIRSAQCANEFTIEENLDYVIAYSGTLSDSDCLMAKAKNYMQGEETAFSECFDALFFDCYTMFLYDKHSKSLVAYEHALGGKFICYAVDDGETVWFSDSLKILREQSGLKFEFNKGLMPHFLYNGFLYGADTLIKHVKKLIPGAVFRFDRETIEIKKECFEKTILHAIDGKTIEKNSLKNSYMDIVPTSILRAGNSLLQKSGQLNVTLSGGYDSNLILHTLKKEFPDKRIDCFSVGGVSGRDETEQAQLISTYYENTCFHKGMVSSKTKEMLPEIVERLEGAVYERGVFLQFELANLLNKNQCKGIVCGECADQVFNHHFFFDVPEDHFVFEFSKHPRQLAAYLVKQKNQLMLKSFGIEAFYPFLDRRVLELAYSLREKNGEKKAFHKEMCREQLDGRIVKMLEKKGGSTALQALFDAGIDGISEAKKLSTYDEKLVMMPKYSEEESKLDYYMTHLYLETFVKMFCEN